MGGEDLVSESEVARQLDAYAGAAGDMDPAIGTISVPIRLVVENRKALREMEKTP